MIPKWFQNAVKRVRRIDAIYKDGGHSTTEQYSTPQALAAIRFSLGEGTEGAEQAVVMAYELGIREGRRQQAEATLNRKFAK